MSFDSEYLELRKKRKKQQEEGTQKVVSGNPLNTPKQQTVISGNPLIKSTQDLAPVRVVSTFAPVTSDAELTLPIIGELDLFQEGALKSGVTAKNVGKAILGTTGDIALGSARGVMRFAEGIGDAINYGIAGVSDLVGADDFAEGLRNETKKSVTDQLFGDQTQKVAKWSVLGDSSRNFTEQIGNFAIFGGLGALGNVAGLGKAGITALTTGTMGASGIGSGMSEAYQGGATDEQALKHGLNVGTIEALSELLFGGMGKAVNSLGFSKGITSIDDMFAKKVSNLFTNQFAKNVAEYSVKAGAEGVEEIVAGVGNILSKKFTLMSDKDWLELIEDENLLEQFFAGTLSSGFAQSYDLYQANKTGTDFVSGLTQDEQSVVDKVVADRVAEKEAKGEAVSNKDKNKIYDSVVSDLNRGYIGAETINEMFGGEAYTNYKALAEQQAQQKASLESEKSQLQSEIEALENANNTIGNANKYNDAKSKLEDIENKLKELNKKSLDDAFKMNSAMYKRFGGTKLGESYNEWARRFEGFKADYSKFKDAKHQDAVKQTLENAEKSGMANTNKMRDLVEMNARFSADTGVVFKYKSGEEIKNDFIERQTAEIKELESITERTPEQDKLLAELKETLEDVKSGKLKVNGNITDDGIEINLNSPEALNFVTGHEITHNLEKLNSYTELVDSLKKFAGKDFDKRVAKQMKTYKGVSGYDSAELKADAEREVVADLVGEYLFSDEKFINSLSTENPNLFKRIYNEIKYLCKIATAGSREARELEKVKRAFEKAYKESANTKTDTKTESVVESGAEGDTKYSFSGVNPNENTNGIAIAEQMEVDGKSSEEIRQETGWFRSYDNKWRYEIDDSKAVWHLDTAKPDSKRLFNFGEKWYKLGDLLEHEELYKAYPQLKNVNVWENPYTEFGGYVMGRGVDTMAVQSLDDEFSIKGTILHELQHIIQNIEGFARGASKYEYSYKEWGDKEYNALFKRYEVAKKLYAVLRRNGESISKEDIEYNQNSTSVSDEIIERNYFTLQSLGAENKRTQALIDEYYEQVRILNATTPEGQYYSTAGEIEANDTMARRYMSAEERRKDRPNIDREDVIVKYSLSEEQQEYFKDSVVRDDNGNLKVMYHGTSKGGHTVFDTYGSNYGLFGQGSYFTDNKSVAESYTNKGKGNNKQVYETYLNITNPLDMDAQGNIEEWQKAFPDADFSNCNTNEEFYRAVEEFYADQMMPKWEVAEEIKDTIAFKMGYDGITHIGGGRVNADGTRHQVYIAFEPEQIKNIDNIAPTKDADIRYSFSSIANTFFEDENMVADRFQKADYKQTQGYKDYVETCLNNYKQTRADFDETVARKEIEDQIDGIVRVAVASKIAGYDILDDGEKRDLRDSKNRLLFSSLEPNSEYTTSHDISTLCDKRRNFAEIYDAIVKREEALGVPQGKRFFDNVDNYFYIHKVLADKGLTQPCRQCYVESMRKNLTPMATAFLELVNETNPNNKSNKQLYQQSGKNKGNLKSNNAKLRERVLGILAKDGMSAEELSVEMLTTEDGLAHLRLQAPLVYEAFNSFYGQSKPKMPKSATPFRFGELTALLTDDKGKINQRLMDNINSTGGFRLQSYSDFQIENFVDTLQVLFEAGTLGLNAHAYTKVPAFLDATEGTNLKRNISIFMYKDGDEWKLDKNDSFPYELDEIYDIVKNDKSGNTSIIAVSQNADMSAWIMANDNIGYFIPFHKSGLKMGVVRDTKVRTEDGRTVKGYSNAIDHTKQQTEVWAKTTAEHKANTKVKKAINIYSFWDFDNKSNLSKNDLIKKNVKAYIDACEMAGYLPKFRDYVMNNDKVLNNVLKYSKELGFVSQDATIDDISFEYKGYRIPYGYYKCLGDFGMFTPDGKASPHDTVSLANYDFDKAVAFFDDAQTLRRNEILQQFSNGEERRKYRDSDLTAGELEDIVRQKRNEVADSIVAPTQNSLSREGELHTRGYSDEIRYKQDIAPVVEKAPVVTTEQVKPTQEVASDIPDGFAPLTEEEAIAYARENFANLDDEDAPPVRDTERYNLEDDITIDDKSIRQLTKTVSDTLSMSRGSRAELEQVIRDFSNNKYSTKEDLYADIERRFGTVYTEELNDTLADAKDFVRNVKIYVTPTEKSDFGSPKDYTQFMRSNFGKIKFSKEGRGVDAVYQELNEMYPHLFPDDVWNSADQLRRIAEVMNTPTKDLIPEALPSEIIEEATDLIYDSILEYKDTERFNIAYETYNEANEYLFGKDAPIQEAPTREYEAIKPRPEKLIGEEEQWAKNRMARADKVKGNAEQTANIIHNEPKAEMKKSNIWSKFVSNFVDKGAPVETLALKKHNRELDGKYHAIKRAEGMAQTFIAKGTEGVKSLKDLLEEVKNDGLVEAFDEYLYHKHNVDRMTLEDRYEDVPNKAVFGDTVTAEVSQEIVNQYELAIPKLKEYAQDIYNIHKHLRKMLVSDGDIISQETADLWEEMYPHYVPIHRKGDLSLSINVPLDTGKTGVNAPIKRATGGNQDFYSVFETTAERILQTYKAVAKNRFGVELKNTLGTTIENAETSLDEVVENIDTQDSLLQEGKNGRNPTFTVFENGEKVTFEISEEMYDALKPTSKGLATTVKPLKFLNDVRRGLLTEYNPTFILTNPIKDSQDVLMNSQHPVQTYKNFPKAIAELWNKNGRWYNEYMENGGEQNTYFDKETNAFKEEKTGIAKLIRMPLDKISDANNFIERIPRLAEYIASREAGRSVDVSMLDSARVTTNFSAGGDVTKFANRNGFTFLNASVQGAVQQVRNVREAKYNGLKGWVQLGAKTLIAGLPAMLLNGLLWDDDEEYEELSDYVKENYYIIAKFDDGKFVRIPKGRAVAVIQNAFEQIGNALTGDDEVDLKRFTELVISNLAPNNPLDNNIIAPLKQAIENKTWYKEDLVPSRLQDLPTDEQYDESTDAISKWLGENFDPLNFGAYKINYVLDQYLGGVGDMVLPMLTPEAESGDNSLGGNLLAPLKDKFSTDSVMNNQVISDFYKTSDELTTNAKSSKATDEDILKYKYINSVQTEMGELYAEKREIQNSNLSDAVKYKKVREIQEEINALSENALNTYGIVNIDGNYANVGDRHYRLNDENEWQKINDKQLEKQEEVTSGLGITPAEYWNNKAEYDYAYDSPEKYAVAKAVGGYSAYKTYSSELYDIKADKDKYGKSISGSRKEKVLDYINNLDIDYYEKLILFKSEYNADDTYNYEIIDYLNNRDDISYEEEVIILKELGFNVDSNGNISW